MILLLNYINEGKTIKIEVNNFQEFQKFLGPGQRAFYAGNEITSLQGIRPDIPIVIRNTFRGMFV